MSKTIEYTTSTETAMKKLRNALSRLGAAEMDYGHTSGRNDSSAYIAFNFKGEKFKFEYSRSRAEYFGIKIPNYKDILIILINGIVDLTRLAERGVFDFGKLIEGHKALEFIEVPEFFKFMGFQTIPRNAMEVESRYRELARSSMNPEVNPEDFMKLQRARSLAIQYFGGRA